MAVQCGDRATRSERGPVPPGPRPPPRTVARLPGGVRSRSTRDGGAGARRSTSPPNEVDLATGLLWGAPEVGAVAEAPGPRGGSGSAWPCPRPGPRWSPPPWVAAGRWRWWTCPTTASTCGATTPRWWRSGTRLVVRPPRGPWARWRRGRWCWRWIRGPPSVTAPTPRPGSASPRWRPRCGSGAGLSVLDVGCGSGVLAVAAAVLAARVGGGPRRRSRRPRPRPATNAARNGVAGCVQARLVGPEDDADPLAAAPGPADLVVANIGARALVALAPHLRDRPGARRVPRALGPAPPAPAGGGRRLRAARARSTGATLDGWVALPFAVPTVDLTSWAPGRGARRPARQDRRCALAASTSRTCGS